ncbi:MAG: YkgJ family cysteine cluster protein [bacterium]|jgi:uncharacterized protein|nr:YkgJ family cysteine cluster protein [Planctomycetota bacterium]HIL52927.1 YkgJ family cysteine cluster protein [Planctomycetota bacterium]
MPHKPWYHKGLQFSCQRSGNCCKTHGEYAFVYLAETDIVAIAGFLKLDPEEFREQYTGLEEDLAILRIDSPRCTFLQADNSCSIWPVRPKQCASWPFWQENLDDRTRWEGPVKACCAGIGQGPLHSAEDIEREARETEEWYD